MKDVLYIFILSSGVLLLGILVGKGIRPRINTQIVSKIFRVWKAVAIVLLLFLCLSFFDVYLRGYWTTKCLIWMFVIISAFLAVFGNQVSTSKWVRSIWITIAVIPAFCTLLYLAVGAGGSLLMHHVLVRIGGSNDFIFYNDETFRIERDNRGIRNPRSPRIFKKIGPIEIDLGFIECTNKPDSVKLTIRQDSVVCFCYDKAYKESGLENPHISTFVK